MTNNTRAKVGQATAWSSVTEILAKLISPIVNIVLARLLLPEAFGTVATITLVITFAEVFTDAGFQKYLIQHEFENEEDLNNSTNVAFWTNLSVSVFACLIIFIFRHSIAGLVGNPELGNAISVASLLIILAAFSSIQMARYKRQFDFKTLFFVRIGTSLIPLVVTIPLAVVLRNFWALLIGNFASQLFHAVVLTVKSKWKIKLYYNFALLRQMFSFSMWTLLESISIWLTTNLDIFIISSFLSGYYLGLYKTSMSTVNSYMGLITAAVIPVLFSALSRNQNDDAGFKAVYYTFQRMTAVFVVPMGVGIFLFRDFVTLLLLGEKWMEASGFIGWWGITSAMAILFSHFPSEVYRSKGKPKISLFIQLGQILVLVPVLLVCKNYSFKVLYIARALVRIEIVLSSFIIMSALFQFRIKDSLKNTLPMISAAIVMGAVGYVAKQFSPHILWQFGSILICIVVYFAVLLGAFPGVRRELLELRRTNNSCNKLS